MKFSAGHLFSLSGRCGRLEYFLHTILDVVFIVLMFFTASVLFSVFGLETSEGALVLVTLAIILLGGAVEFCATIRRLHDINLSGWMILLTLVPIANIVIGLMLLFKRGEVGDNAYGPSPI